MTLPRYVLTLTKWLAFFGAIFTGFVALLGIIVHGGISQLPLDVRETARQAWTEGAIFVLADAIEKRWSD